MFWRSAKAAKKEEDVEESEALVISPGSNGHGSSGNLRGLASPAGDRRKATRGGDEAEEALLQGSEMSPGQMIVIGSRRLGREMLTEGRKNSVAAASAARELVRSVQRRVHDFTHEDKDLPQWVPTWGETRYERRYTFVRLVLFVMGVLLLWGVHAMSNVSRAYHTERAERRAYHAERNHVAKSDHVRLFDAAGMERDHVQLMDAAGMERDHVAKSDHVQLMDAARMEMSRQTSRMRNQLSSCAPEPALRAREGGSQCPAVLLRSRG
mmetsp:Transcript_46356/g.148542  ORF Transcript_46356/g.148542 Transcript_46356/m.148542 type:complete len:267 (-) Transcript_46356:376-1176(-)